jgi:ATP-dependent RNA helicase DDX54/DBP10
MFHRAASPDVSKNEFDIIKSLVRDEISVQNKDSLGHTAKETTLGNILDLGWESDEDGDENFIAAQQAASNRKSSNIKCKSVKKGGGFQAMGR